MFCDINKARQENLMDFMEKKRGKRKYDKNLKEIQILLCCKKPRVQKSAKIRLPMG